MKILTTSELKDHIETLYERMRPVAAAEGIFIDLIVKFNDEPEKMWPGSFCYSDGKHYYYGSVGDFGAITSEKFDDLFDPAYRIFKNQTFKIGIKYLGKYLATNEKPQDTRRIVFPKEVELLRLIGEEYAQRREKEIEEILKKAPYRD